MNRDTYRAATTPFGRRTPNTNIGTVLIEQIITSHHAYDHLMLLNYKSKTVIETIVEAQKQLKNINYYNTFSNYVLHTGLQ
jgi:hypothetical protein